LRHPGPLKSRFGRRLQLLFVGSTVLPTAVVATLSYRQVTRYLVAQKRPGDAAISTAIIALGHALGLSVTAEGVETVEQVDLLRKQGCDQMQGYYFSRPLPAEAMAELLRDRKAGRSGQAAGTREERAVILSAAKEIKALMSS
jgi:predicted signal transduction protein with EAL and GGDEF domain